MRVRTGVILAAALATSGCIAKTAVDIVTLPVKAGAQVVDWSTTSQDEADRNYGREMRKLAKKCRKDPHYEECDRLDRGRYPERED